MVHIAVVDDDMAFQDSMRTFLLRYAKEQQQDFQIDCYTDGLDFLHSYRASFDLIFMDIEMPYMDGLKAAKRLRELDRSVILVFVTNMAQYAIRGYEVNAMSYLLKPVNYFSIQYLMKRIITELSYRTQTYILIPSNTGMARLVSDEILYIEVLNHRLIFHTTKGNYEMFGTLKRMEEHFRSCHFAQCGKSYLVNLRYVTQVEKNTVYVKDCPLQISRPRKAAFLMALTEYYGSGGN